MYDTFINTTICALMPNNSWEMQSLALPPPSEANILISSWALWCQNEQEPLKEPGVIPASQHS